MKPTSPTKKTNATKATFAKGGKPAVGSGERFAKMTKSLAAKGAKDPKALAAYIGRKKYGAQKMQKMAAAGRRGK